MPSSPTLPRHSLDVPEWARVRRGSRTHVASLDPRSTALVVVDVQQGFVAPGWPMSIPGAAEIIPNVNRLIDIVRRSGGHVVCVRHTFSDQAPGVLAEPYRQFAPRDEAGAYILRAGGDAHQLHSALDVAETDLIIDKFRFSALHPDSSPMRQELDARGVQTVIIAGLATNVCCESTARDAQMCGWKVIFVSDATATHTDEEHRATLINLARVFADVRTTADTVDLFAIDKNTKFDEFSNK